MFLLDPTNETFARGEGRALPLGQYGCMIVFMIPFVAAAVLLAGLTLQQWIRFIRLNTNAAELRGEHISREVDYSDDAPSYYVTFQFVVDGRAYTVSEDVREETYDAVDAHESLLVRFVQTDPSVATIEPDRPIGLMALAGFCLLWDGIVLSLTFVRVRDYLRRQRLAHRGQRITGQILRCGREFDSDGDFTLRVDFRFRSPRTIAWIEDTCAAVRNDLKGKPLPELGTSFHLLYLDENTYLAL